MQVILCYEQLQSPLNVSHATAHPFEITFDLANRPFDFLQPFFDAFMTHDKIRDAGRNAGTDPSPKPLLETGNCPDDQNQKANDLFAV